MSYMNESYNPRVKSMLKKIQNDYNEIANALGWNVDIDLINNQHSYVVFSIHRNSITHKFGYLYSQSTSREVYHLLELQTEIVFIYGMDFNNDNLFSQGCKILVLPDNDFLYVMTDWNMKFLGKNLSKTEKERAKRDIIQIIEENPLQQIYSYLYSLTSKVVAKQAVQYHLKRNSLKLNDDIVVSKAEGVSYLIQNVIDYYNDAINGNLTRRMLNLYYGTIALMEAEMLICGEKYSHLSEIEDITKFGHGMCTFGVANSLKDFYIGVMDKGLFQAWLAHQGVRISDFPNSRKKAETSDFKISLDDLFCHIPELQNIMQETEQNYKPYFLFPEYDISFNNAFGSLGLKANVYERNFYGSYVNFFNIEGAHDSDWEKQLIESFLAPITIVGECKSMNLYGWRTFIEHRRDGRYYESCRIHKGLSTSAVIAPLFGRTDKWEVFAVMILYALSIIVRYRPNLWARILHGDLDYYKAVVYQFSRVAERELTQIFLEKLTGKGVTVTHPQGLI